MSLIMQNIWNKRNGNSELTGPIRSVHRYVKMPGQKAEFYNYTTQQLEKVINFLLIYIICNIKFRWDFICNFFF